MNYESAYNNLRTRLELLERDFREHERIFSPIIPSFGYAKAMKHVKAIVEDVHAIHELRDNYNVILGVSNPVNYFSRYEKLHTTNKLGCLIILNNIGQLIWE